MKGAKAKAEHVIPAGEAMRMVQLAARGGRVVVEMNESGAIYARAFPDLEAARRVALPRLKESERASAEGVHNAIEREHARQLAYGTGRTVEAALADLLRKLLEKNETNTPNLS